MSNFIKWVRSWLTMKRKHCMFVDVVSGEEVFLYIDCYGQRWMADFNRFGFRIKEMGEKS